MTDTPTELAADPVLAERRGAVLVLTLNRPERLNAWSDALEQRYFALLADAERDPDVRAIVVTGAGRGFCGGADVDDLERAGGGDADVVALRRPRAYPLTVRKPLIAALNGAAAGLGLVEALYCDVRFCVAEAKLTTVFARRGLIAEYGISWLLERLVGQGRAADLLLSGRVVRGEEALAMGLVDRIVAPAVLLEESIAYAQDLAANCSPTAMAVIKRQLRRDLEIGFEQAFADAERLRLESFGWPDVAEGVASYLERRPSAFPPLAPEA